MQDIKHKAIEIAVRTFFSDAVGIEHEIWEWLCATESDDSHCPYLVWGEVNTMTNTELWEVTHELRADIRYTIGS